jgi:hypothetical protein
MGLFRVLSGRQLPTEFRGMTVQAWLDSERDYEVGRLLYHQLGDNARLKQLLGHGPNSYNREALAWELGKLAKAGVVTPVTINVTAPAQLTDIDVLQSADEMPKKVQNATETLQTEAPNFAKAALLIPLSQARRPLYSERTLLHGQLELLAEKGTQEEVRQAAERIMQLSRELDANWKIDAYVREKGHLPPPPPAAPGLETLSPAELLKKRNNLRSQVSKLKKQPHRADDLAKVEATLNQVEALLKPAE